jgi:APA family basic amino acid/polyamine antiporter
MALTVVSYAAPGAGRPVRSVAAVAVVAALTALNYRGVRKSAWVTRAIVIVVLLVLAMAVAASFSAGTGATAAKIGHLDPFSGTTAGGVLRSAGLLFFAFAGYARIATLGEEVRDPRRTIPRAVPLALGITLAVYASVAVAVLYALGPGGLARAADPLARATTAGAAPWLTPVVRTGAAVAALGSLLALILGVSRTTFAMARDGHLPKTLNAVHPRFHVPHRAEIAVGVVAGLVDLRGAIGFSSFAVLAYYAIANASAWTLGPGEGRPPRIVPVAGFAGCLVLAFSLPAVSVFSGVVALGAGAAVWSVRRILASR